jgi:DNA primase
MPRMVAAILVQHPELAAEVKDQDLPAELDGPGMPVIRELVGLLHRQPGLNTAAIVEHFRDSEHQHSVSRLATWTHPALQHDAASELKGALVQMRKNAMREKIDNLLQKDKISGLSPEEKRELAHLTRLQVEKPETSAE